MRLPLASRGSNLPPLVDDDERDVGASRSFFLTSCTFLSLSLGHSAVAVLMHNQATLLHIIRLHSLLL